MSENSIEAMNLSTELARAVNLMGFESLTPIQSQAIPVIREGHDLVARSQTGTGKTVAFGIPAIEAIDNDAKKGVIQVLILCPTRELAQQGADELRKLARFMPEVQPVEIYGGAPIDKQCIRLRRANIVIGTPGRVMDHMRRKTIKLSSLKMLVLDEADEMLNMGFKDDIETILCDTPETRQTVLFSATMPAAIMAITKQYQHEPKLIEIDKAHVTLDNISQTFINVPHASKQASIDLLLQYYRPNRAIIFCNTKSMVDELSAHLNESGFSAEALHGDLKQAQRTAVMHAFKSGRVSILVATDIAARGIDVSDVEYVINFDLPQNTEYYVHRIGRTGRAGRTGVSVTICSGKREAMIMRNIAHAVKSEITEVPVPSVSDVKKENGKEMASKVIELLEKGADDVYKRMANELMQKGFLPEEVAAAALQLSAGKATAAVQGLSDVPSVKFKDDYASKQDYKSKPRRDHRFGGKPNYGYKKGRK
ncbi:MAG: DEAD/DEAH box helicase [Clostridia bacterium]|nr:DEAD/DEAH box helicase [Clostridia bacterium]NLS85365.1 DEAD/DEAH box helicase [Oscillospiraceae bacterium]